MSDKERLKIRLTGSPRAIQQAIIHLRLLYDTVSESQDYPRRNSIERAVYLEADVRIEDEYLKGKQK